MHEGVTVWGSRGGAGEAALIQEPGQQTLFWALPAGFWYARATRASLHFFNAVGNRVIFLNDGWEQARRPAWSCSAAGPPPCPQGPRATWPALACTAHCYAAQHSTAQHSTASHSTHTLATCCRACTKPWWPGSQSASATLRRPSSTVYCRTAGTAMLVGTAAPTGPPAASIGPCCRRVQRSAVLSLCGALPAGALLSLWGASFQHSGGCITPCAGTYKLRRELNFSVEDMVVVHAGFIPAPNKASAGEGAQKITVATRRLRACWRTRPPPQTTVQSGSDAWRDARRPSRPVPPLTPARAGLQRGYRFSRALLQDSPLALDKAVAPWPDPAADGLAK